MSRVARESMTNTPSSRAMAGPFLIQEATLCLGREGGTLRTVSPANKAFEERSVLQPSELVLVTLMSVALARSVRRVVAPKLEVHRMVRTGFGQSQAGASVSLGMIDKRRMGQQGHLVLNCSSRKHRKHNRTRALPRPS